MKTSIRERVKLLRTHLNLTQQDFCALCDLTNTSLSRIENGEVEPQKMTIQKMIDNTGVNPEWLIDGKGELKVQVLKKKRQVSDPWKEEAYTSLKQNNSYLQNKLDEANLFIKHLLSKGGELGKSKALEFAALVHNAKRVSRVRVNK